MPVKTAVTTPAFALPAAVRPVFRKASALVKLTKPSLTLYVAITTVLGLHWGSPHTGWALFLATFIGTALSSGGACGLNMVIEYQADAKMTRTRRRPIPAGDVTRTEALIFSLALLVLGAALLAWQANLLTLALSLTATALYVFVYTPLKRKSPIATWVGAIPGALPPVMGFCAAQGRLGVQALLVFAILFFWQLPHFYALALMYREDYAKGGFKVQPIEGGFDRAAIERQIAFTTIALLAASAALFAFGYAGWFYLSGAALAGAWIVAKVVALLRTHAPRDARRLFFATLVYLPVLVVALLLDTPHPLRRFFGLA